MIAFAGVAALVLALVALVGPVARRYGRSRATAVAVAAALALVAEPVRAALGRGGLDLVLFGLVTADLVALRRSAWARSRAAWWPGPPASRPPASRSAASRVFALRLFGARPGIALLRRAWATGAWAGVGIGVATALALGPIVFLVYLMVSRQWRAAMTAAGTATAVLGGATLLGRPPSFGGDGPLDDPLNQSLAGVLARLYDSSGAPVLIWLSFSGLLLAVGMIRARSAHADGDEIAAFTLAGLTGAAIGPVSGVHALIWLLPTVLILVDAAARLRVTTRRPRKRRFPGAGHAAAAALVYALILVGPRWTTGWNGYAFAMILLLNALPWRPGVAPAVPTRRPRPPQPLRRVPAIPGPRGS